MYDLSRKLIETVAHSDIHQLALIYYNLQINF